jgi:activating signal cointegrator complex subunit 3
MVVPVKIAGKDQTFGKVIHTGYENPHVKVLLLLQCHLTRGVKFASTDYITDSNTCLDSSIRILQAMIDISAAEGFLSTTLGVINLLQCVKQAMWPSDSQLFSLPHVTRQLVDDASKMNLITIKDALKLGGKKLSEMLSKTLGGKQVKEMVNVLIRLPIVSAAECEIYAVDGEEADLCPDNVVKAGQSCILQVELTRSSLSAMRSSHGVDIPVYCPRFPKAQSEGWIVVLGDGTVLYF